MFQELVNLQDSRNEVLYAKIIYQNKVLIVVHSRISDKTLYSSLFFSVSEGSHQNKTGKKKKRRKKKKNYLGIRKFQSVCI